MPTWLSLLEIPPAAYGTCVAVNMARDGIHRHLLRPLRQRRWQRHAIRDSDPIQMRLDGFRAIHAPAAALAVAIITTDGIELRCSGHDRGRPIDAGTRFEIGSISKTFTAALLREMVARDEVELDTPLHALLPHAPASESPRPVTLADLACHGSGLPRLPYSPRMLAGLLLHPRQPYAWLREDEAMRWPRGKHLRRVGARYAYSNLGAGLLGEVLARRLDMSLDEAWRQRLLSPLGLHATCVADATTRGDIAQPHAVSGRALPVWRLRGLNGAGGLCANIDDMARWVRAHIEVTPPLHADTIAPRRRIDAHGSVALGWHLWHRTHGDIAWHNGATGGSRSFAAFDRQRGIGVAVLCNQAVPVEALGMQCLRAATT